MFVVQFSYTLIQPYAVMIECGHAVVAFAAVLWSRDLMILDVKLSMCEGYEELEYSSDSN